MKEKLILIVLALLSIVLVGVSAWKWTEVEKKQTLLMEVKQTYERDLPQIEATAKEKIAEIQKEFREQIEQQCMIENEKATKAIAMKTEECNKLTQKIQKIGESPMLDALRNRYGEDVNRWTTSKVFIQKGMWESFSYSDGRVVFTFHNKGESAAALDVSVTFFNEYGLVTGKASYDMSTSLRSFFGFNGTKSFGQEVHEVKCPLYLGQPAYYIVSVKSIER